MVTTNLTWTFADSTEHDDFFTALADRYGFTYSGASEAETLVIAQIKSEQVQAYANQVGNVAGASAASSAYDAAAAAASDY